MAESHVLMNAEKPSVAHNVDHNEIAKFEAVASRCGAIDWDLEANSSRAAISPAP